MWRRLAMLSLVLGATACGDDDVQPDDADDDEVCGETADAPCAEDDPCTCWAPQSSCCDAGFFCRVTEWCGVETETGCTTQGACAPKVPTGQPCELSQDCSDSDAVCAGTPRLCVVGDFCGAPTDPCVQDADCCSDECLGFSGFQPGYCG